VTRVSRLYTIGEYAELCIPIWHTGTHEAFLIHVNTALDAIEKQGTFKAYKESDERQCKTEKQAKANLALLTGSR
jgi:hypothetical protein